MGAFEDLILKYVFGLRPNKITGQWLDSQNASIAQAVELASRQIREAADRGEAPCLPVGFSGWYRSEQFRKANVYWESRGRQEPSLAALYLHPEAHTAAILDSLSAIRTMGNRPALVVLAGDEELAKREKIIGTEDFQLLESRSQPYGQYRAVLAAAEKTGKIYEMIKLGSEWGYVERQLIDSLGISRRQPGQQLCLFRREELVVLLRGAG